MDAFFWEDMQSDKSDTHHLCVPSGGSFMAGFVGQTAL